MIAKVRGAGIYVSDRQRARDFWTETLGFELVLDAPMARPPAGRAGSR